jgi:serine/threonine-protein kinase
MKCPKCQAENMEDSRFCKKCAAPLPYSEGVVVTETIETPKEELTTGSMFAGRYQIIEELGRGGMGRVYRVLDKKLNEEVALKLIKSEIASDKKTVERFSNELKIARKIVHKNIARMFDLNEEKGTHFFTMEYVRGEDLKKLIRKMGRLSPGQAITIANQVCEGLTEAHKLGVIHRDLKPQNVMVDEEGNARIMDFGIARSLEGKGLTGAGVMIGTPDYMSPEQVEGKETDQRSDIYSLGIILYEMVTGQVPFEGDTPFTIGVKHKSEVPKDPKEMNAQIPDDLSDVILKCLEKEKGNRYQSAEDLHSDLSNIEKGLPTSEKIIPERKPLTSREITVQFSMKNYLVAVFFVLAVAVIAIVIWQLLHLKEQVTIPTENPSIAVLPFEDRSPKKDQGYLCDGLSESIINALSRVEGLRVPARSSSFSFKEKVQNAKEIGEILSTKTVLEGSLQKAENRIRITAQLINVADGSVFWSTLIDKEEADIFAIQDEITLAIVDELKFSLLGDERERLKQRYTENVKAYNLYLQGRYFWDKRTKEGIEKSIEYFQKAIAEDPTYALAYVGISDSYNILGDWNFFPSKEVYPKAKKAAEKALELDDLLGEAHISLADYKAEYEWDWEGAEREFKLGLKLNPDYPSGHQWYSEYLLKIGRYEEALEEIDKAIELDPLSPIVSAQKAYNTFFALGHEKALKQLQKTFELEPQFRPALYYRGMINYFIGRYEEALKDYEILDDDWGRGIVYAKTGKITEAKQILEAMIKQAHQEYIPNIMAANLYFVMGDKENGFQWLEKSFEERERILTFIRFNPIFDNIRSEPRFKAILKKMNLGE